MEKAAYVLYLFYVFGCEVQDVRADVVFVGDQTILLEAVNSFPYRRAGDAQDFLELIDVELGAHGALKSYDLAFELFVDLVYK